MKKLQHLAICLSAISYFCLGASLARSAEVSIEERSGNVAASSGIVYWDVERTQQIRFTKNDIRIGPFPGYESEEGRFAEDLGSDLTDCSGPSFRCVNAGYIVFAVPKTMLRPRLKYTAGSAYFTVLKCMGGKTCPIALIAMECKGKNYSTHSCVLEGQQSSEKMRSGPQLGFIYNQKFGITSFGFANLAGSKVLDVAKQFVLQGEMGLLQPL